MKLFCIRSRKNERNTVFISLRETSSHLKTWESNTTLKSYLIFSLCIDELSYFISRYCYTQILNCRF